MPKPPENTEFASPLTATFLNFKPRKGDLRRAKILEATIACLTEIGIENTTFESIGKKAGMLRAHVAYYYKDRNQIIVSAIKFAVANVQSLSVEHVTAAKTPKERLAAFIEGTFAWAEKFPHHPGLILLLYYLSTVDKSYREMHDQIREMGAQRLTAIVSETFPKATKAENYRRAKSVQAILTGHLVDHTTTKHHPELRKLRTQTLRDAFAAIDLTYDLSPTKKKLST